METASPKYFYLEQENEKDFDEVEEEIAPPPPPAAAASSASFIPARPPAPAAPSMKQKAKQAGKEIDDGKTCMVELLDTAGQEE